MSASFAARIAASGLVVLTSVAAACSVPPGRPAPGPGPAAAPLRVQVAQDENRIRGVAVEDYVRGAILSEFAPPSEDPDLVARMLDVQAIVARTYALANRGRHAPQGFDLCSTTHCQLYEPSRLRSSRWASSAGEAVRRTAGAILWYASGPAEAVFHADCGGHTTTPVDAWAGSARPYLRAAADGGPAAGAHARWTYTVETATLVAALNKDPRTRIGRGLAQVTVVDRDRSGRAATVALHGERERLVTGETFRAVLSRTLGARAVKSTLFSVRHEPGRFVLDGRGFGHGVGLCQAGALARLRAGARPDEVLAHYYAGTVLRRVNGIPRPSR